MSDKAEHQGKIIIQGLTETGIKFRPSDWAERMCGALSSFRDRRIIYSPLLRPVSIDGVKCVVVDPSLEQSHPSLYKHIQEFAKKNHLRVS